MKLIYNSEMWYMIMSEKRNRTQFEMFQKGKRNSSFETERVSLKILRKVNSRGIYITPNLLVEPQIKEYWYFLEGINKLILRLNKNVIKDTFASFLTENDTPIQHVWFAREE